jgi:hypothetical protein
MFTKFKLEGFVQLPERVFGGGGKLRHFVHQMGDVSESLNDLKHLCGEMFNVLLELVYFNESGV